MWKTKKKKKKMKSGKREARMDEEESEEHLLMEAHQTINFLFLSLSHISKKSEEFLKNKHFF